MGQKQSLHRYSITSLARCWRGMDTTRPSALAVLRLITSSYLVGAWTGSSPGFLPLRTLSNSTVQVFDMRGALLGSEPVRPGDDILSVARRSLRKGATPSFYRPISYPPQRRALCGRRKRG